MPKFFKITLFAVIAFNTSITASAQTQFTLSGKISGAPDAFLFLKYKNSDGKRIVDSCSLKNNTFIFKGDVEVNEPTPGTLIISTKPHPLGYDSDPNCTSFFLEPGTIIGDGVYNHLKDISIQGSKINDDAKILGEWQAKFDKEGTDLVRQFTSTEWQWLTELRKPIKDQKKLTRFSQQEI